MNVTAIIISIIITLIFVYIFVKYYQYIEAQYPTIDNQLNNFNIPIVVNDWQDALAIDSHTYAMRNWCLDNGYDYVPPASTGDIGSCAYNQASCLADSNPNFQVCLPCPTVTGASGASVSSLSEIANAISSCAPRMGLTVDGVPCSLDQKPYLEWVPSVATGSNGVCLLSPYSLNIKQHLCDPVNLGWNMGNFDCDSNGNCVIKSDYKYDLPTCVITSDYCNNYGMDYSSDGPLGDCEINDAQNIAESIFGKTITRTFKINGENMVKQCESDFFSGNCAKAIGTTLGTLGEIGVATGQEIFTEVIDNAKDACAGDIYSSTDNFLKCQLAVAEFNPAIFATVEGEKFVNNILNGALGWIPGMPSDLLNKAIGYIVKYGEVAFNAIVAVGAQAVHAFDIAGDAMSYALQKVGLGSVASLASTVIGFGVKAAKAVAILGSECLELLENVITQTIGPAVLTVITAVSSAFLHPVDFCKSLASDIVAFVKDPIGSIKSAFTAFINLGGEVLTTVKMVISHLKTAVVGAVDAIASALNDVINTLVNVVDKVVDDIEKAAEAIWHGIESIF